MAQRDSFFQCECINQTDCSTIATSSLFQCATITQAKLNTGMCTTGKNIQISQKYSKMIYSKTTFGYFELRCRCGYRLVRHKLLSESLRASLLAENALGLRYSAVLLRRCRILFVLSWRMSGQVRRFYRDWNRQSQKVHWCIQPSIHSVSCRVDQ